jgi:hypothetical protein
MLKAFFIIIFLAVVGVVLGGVFLVAGSGLYPVPWLTKALKADKPRDFGLVANEQLFTDKLNEQQVKLTPPYGQYCFTCNIVYSETSPMNVSFDSNEITSYLQMTNNSFGPLQDIQLKLGDNNSGEASAWLDLTSYGYDVKGPIYMAGSFQVDSPTSLSFNIETAKLGLLPVPAQYVAQAESELDKLVNSQLKKMAGLNIQNLEVSAGTLLFQGDFPHTASTK